MDFKNTTFWIWWREYGKHIEAIIIILLLITVWFTYSNNNKLQKEISLNCGWAKEDYQCYCEKSKAIEIKNKLENKNLDINLSSYLGERNVSMD